MNEPGAAIRLEELRQFPERPASEFEWEDLLLRLELMPRALRVELEKGAGEEVAMTIAEATRRELAVQRLLEEVAIADHLPADAPASGPVPVGALPASEVSVQPSPQLPVAPPTDGAHPGAGMDRFVRLRGRNFAMLQRRGIDVWNWRIRVPPHGDATVFQLLSLLARNDVEILSRLRKARTSASAACLS